MPSLPRTPWKIPRCFGNALSETDVGTCGEVDFAAPCVFLLQKVEELAVVGQVGDVECDM